MEDTEWDKYGTGKYEKCADCMVHCGYEATAVEDTLSNPLKALWVNLRGIRTIGPLAPEIDLKNARPAEYLFETHVENMLEEIEGDGPPPSTNSAKKGSAPASHAA